MDGSSRTICPFRTVALSGCISVKHTPRRADHHAGRPHLVREAQAETRKQCVGMLRCGTMSRADGHHIRLVAYDLDVENWRQAQARVASVATDDVDSGRRGTNRDDTLGGRDHVPSVIGREARSPLLLRARRRDGGDGAA